MLALTGSGTKFSQDGECLIYGGKLGAHLQRA
jgi:hypothetical protein